MTTLDQIFEQTAKYFLIDKSKLLSKRNFKDIVLPRQVAMYIAKKYYNYTHGTIGEYTERDRTTCIYASMQIQGYVDVNDWAVKDAVQAITKDLGYIKPDSSANEMYLLQKRYDILYREHKELKNNILQLLQK
jgi:hypothetical protein